MDNAAGPQRLLLIAGTILFASGLFHIGVYLLRDGSWAGPISWLKPSTSTSLASF